MYQGVYEKLASGEWVVRINDAVPVDGRVIEVTARRESDDTERTVKVSVYESDGELSRAELVRPGGRYARVRGRWLVVVNALLPVGHETGVVVVKRSGECHIRRVRIVGPAFSRKDVAGRRQLRSLGEPVDGGGVTKPRRQLPRPEAQTPWEFTVDVDAGGTEETEIEDDQEFPSSEEYFDYFPDKRQEYDIYYSDIGFAP